MWAIMRSSPRVCVPANEVSDLIFLLGACILHPCFGGKVITEYCYQLLFVRSVIKATKNSFLESSMLIDSLFNLSKVLESIQGGISCTTASSG